MEEAAWVQAGDLSSGELDQAVVGRLRESECNYSGPLAALQVVDESKLFVAATCLYLAAAQSVLSCRYPEGLGIALRGLLSLEAVQVNFAFVCSS